MPYFSVTALATALLLLATAVRTAYWRLCAPRLPPPHPRPPETIAILPVRNEEENVLPCVESLLLQTARPEVWVVDDNSTDATPRLVAQRAATEPRLKLLRAGPLPRGWRGKVHALSVGSGRASAPWLLFTDADTRHDPDLLARAHAAAEAAGLDAISIAGFQQARSPAESFLIPAVFALLDTLLGDWRPVARGEGPVVANGQFILVRREALEDSGGFEHLQGVVIDDVALFRQLRQTGFRAGFWRSARLWVRMYDGLRAAWDGWRRNLGGIFGERKIVFAVTQTVLLSPIVVLLVALAGGRWREAVVLWTGGALASAIFRGGSRQIPWPALFYPVDALLLSVLLWVARRDYRRGQLTDWKGREMRLLTFPQPAAEDPARATKGAE